LFLFVLTSVNEKSCVEQEVFANVATNETFECNIHSNITVNGVNVSAPQKLCSFLSLP